MERFMRILVIGNGGREHVLIWKLLQSPKAQKVFALPGNGGIAQIVETVKEISMDDHPGILSWVKSNRIDLVVIGPELPLVRGLTDTLKSAGVPVFGPTAAAARMEGSKDFAKSIMKTYGVPTARHETFSDYSQAIEYAYSQPHPLVLKADGLAAGKGVLICNSLSETEKGLKEIMLDRKFGTAGAQVVIEEFMRGEEVSLLALTDGNAIIPLLSAQDHKNILEGDKGPNTGGMGTYSPSPLIDKEMERTILDTILKPTIDGLKKEGILYSGILYAGLMMTDTGPRVVEFNCRFGDPEAQVILPSLENDLVDLMMATVESRLSQVEVKFSKRHTACVVIASGGYPDEYEKGKIISGLDQLPHDVIVFHAGTILKEGQLLTAGGRVLNVVASGQTLQEALDKIYSHIGKIRFEGMYFRRDIGWKALRRYASR
jgi:phosphoribosylamine--glycine ligase